MLRPDAFCDVAGLIYPLERAVKNDRVTELAGALARLGAAGAFIDERLFAPANPVHYARRLIWRDPAGRFVVVGMTWAPGQQSALHDHAGLWGAEIVAGGVMKETTYRLVDRDADQRYMFIRERESILAQGGVSTLLPPLEYHEFGNAGTTNAYTVHVYRGDLDRCTTFLHEEGGWWRAQPASLRYDV